MRSCRSPAGRLKSHQRGFWIETPFQMQKTKALRWLFPGRHILILGGTRSGNTRGKTWDLTQPCPSDLCRMTSSWVGFLTLAPDTQENVHEGFCNFKVPVAVHYHWVVLLLRKKIWKILKQYMISIILPAIFIKGSKVMATWFFSSLNISCLFMVPKNIFIYT